VLFWLIIDYCILVASTDGEVQEVRFKLNFLEKSTFPDIAFGVHTCAKFSINPKACHKSAVIQIARYLSHVKH